MKRSTPRSTDTGRAELTNLEQIPNVGPAVAADLRLLGLARPADLIGRDPYGMYDDLCRRTNRRHDLCLVDTFIAAVRFMGGAPARPWWAYTAERKREFQAREQGPQGERRRTARG
jgi:hypothetical protein